MIQITIERIDGQEYTVVWHGTPTGRANWYKLDACNMYVWLNTTIGQSHIATALPALPRLPRKKDVPLLYRYMAEGLEACGKMYVDDQEGTIHEYDARFTGYECLDEINHATMNGERVEVAIKESE